MARAIKSDEELKCVVASVRATETATARLRDAIRPGITENELRALFHQAVIAQNGDYGETRLLSSGDRTNPWFQEPPVSRLVTSWHALVADACERGRDLAAPFRSFLAGALESSPERLRAKAAALGAILGRRPTAIPPDARHVDYDVIPLNISDGCLYKCRFCRLKNDIPFASRTRKEIEDQIGALAALYGRDLINYNGLFLGEHDALSADPELLLWAVRRAFSALELGQGYMKGRNLFLFGSPDALLGADAGLFDALNALDVRTCINIGLESADPETLARLGKPVGARRVRAGFRKLREINARYRRIEITANFLLGETLPSGHEPSLLELCAESGPPPHGKGTIYLSTGSPWPTWTRCGSLTWEARWPPRSPP